MTHAIKAVLWDMDGTLADSEALHLNTLVTVLNHHGIKAGDDLHASIFGMTAREVHTLCCKLFGIDFDYDEWSMARARHYVSEAINMQPRPGALSVYRAVRAAGIHQAIVSNSPRMLLEAGLHALDLQDPQLITVSANDVRAGKPHPEPYERAAWLLHISPEQAIVVEDSPTGARAAIAAGMRVLAWPEHPGAASSFPELAELVFSEHELSTAIAAALGVQLDT
ncbi:HAD family hydrolase [Caballeronia sordidicola]|uniref:Hydrolase, haloacid dehalogenase-like family n=1 Tax=Caballeronia sordidicola TaxID=196367 RepID=A0A242MLC6_CABSO|nr:HAD family phosphatase [Caballeronia sordidicola]OTP71982.1 hydrolase, haloacid dehalogenase-like family [Caballeronia sordidicola]